MSDLLIPVFVYGTLRPDQGLSWWLESVVDRWEPAAATGKLYYVPVRKGIGPYPVACFDETGQVKGDLVWVPLGEELCSVVTMEIGAGYQIKQVDVRTETSLVKAYAFDWPWPDRGPLIPSGDWTNRFDHDLYPNPQVRR